MRFVVVGAGAVGGVVGGLLSRHGHDVAFVARGGHGATIAERGLTVRSPTGEWVVETTVAPTLGELGIHDGDVVLIAVKSKDTEGALDDLAAAGSPSTPVVCLQNGVVNEAHGGRSIRERLRRAGDVPDASPRTGYGRRLRLARGGDPRRRPISGRTRTTRQRRWRRRSSRRRWSARSARHHALEVGEAAAQPRQRDRGGVRTGSPVRPTRRHRCASRGRSRSPCRRHRVRIGGGGRRTSRRHPPVGTPSIVRADRAGRVSLAVRRSRPTTSTARSCGSARPRRAHAVERRAHPSCQWSSCEQRRGPGSVPVEEGPGRRP